ncbi:hypothetical protein EOPP23_03305 [Endozoicomonas sp. OPT23]|uniref:DsbA family oxidoreductase n=1 Tax=Endozoicomonas sp. OPT23 TaxID=2072845 RepID=UPI00129A5964|nr:DsbA family oxidoreductase [Endozoicomonas sp. OPT23]MRI32026.1 hypothetical protein [Endozoicomonas sp. OPT23]
MKVLKIEMVHDAVCSWCPLGYSNLTTALQPFESDVRARIQLLPYELNPELPPEGETIMSMFQRQWNWSEERIRDYQQDITRQGREVGIEYDFAKRTHYFNTFKAHCLLHWAETFDKHLILNQELKYAYFSQGANISDTDVLLALVSKAGLSASEAEEALHSKKIIEQTQAKQARAKSLSIQSIPAFIFNQKQLVVGSNSVEFFTDLIQSFLDEEAPNALRKY